MEHTRELPLSRINDFGHLLPKAATAEVTIEVMSEDLGDQLAADHLPWRGLSYDSLNHVIEVSVGGRGDTDIVVRHAIQKPARFWIEDRDGAISCISVESTDGHTTMIRFHDRNALGSGSGPAPLSTT